MEYASTSIPGTDINSHSDGSILGGNSDEPELVLPRERGGLVGEAVADLLEERDGLAVVQRGLLVHDITLLLMLSRLIRKLDNGEEEDF